MECREGKDLFALFALPLVRYNQILDALPSDGGETDSICSETAMSWLDLARGRYSQHIEAHLCRTVARDGTGHR